MRSARRVVASALALALQVPIATTAWIALTVFRIAELALLLVASAMLAHAFDRLVAIDWLPTGSDPLWDASSWLPDTKGPGRVLADLAGYRARPSGVLAAVVAAFWCGTLWLLRSAKRGSQ